MLYSKPRDIISHIVGCKPQAYEETQMRKISYKPLWHTLLDRDMIKEDLRIKAGLTTNMIANMGKNKGISMETLERICDALQCEITDVIELVEPEDKE